MKSLRIISAFGGVVAGIAMPYSQAMAATIDNNAAIVQLQSPSNGNCIQAGSTLDNCFTSMSSLVSWISSTRQPSANAPLEVQIGPGQFTGFTCSNGGYTSLKGAGRTNTIIGGPTDYSGIDVKNCHNLDFSDLKVTHKTNAFNTIRWSGGGSSTWHDVDVIGGSYAWVDTDPSGSANSCSLEDRSTHQWFSSRIIATTDVGTTKGYIAQCSESWFRGSEITAKVTAFSSDTVALRVSNNFSEAHVYGSSIAVVSDIATPLTMVAVNALNSGKIHIHGTGIDGVSSNSGSNIIALTVGNGGFIHANETSYNLSTGTSGTITRISNLGGSIFAPYQWQEGINPPVINSATGADTVIETDCGNLSCQTTGSETHFLIYNQSCAGTGGPWFDVVTGSCR